METLSPTVAGMLCEARTRQKLLLREVAERAGVSTTIVSDCELGRRRRPNRETGERLADALALDDSQRAALLAECGTGRGARGPRSTTETVVLQCRGAAAPDPRRGNRHSPRCRKTWTGPRYAAEALRSRGSDGTFVCKNCHGYEVLMRNAAPALVQRARDRAAIETDPIRRRELKAVKPPRTWAQFDRLLQLVEKPKPPPGSGGRRRIGPRSPRQLAASWAASNVTCSLCEGCGKVVFTPRYEANHQGRLNRFHKACAAVARTQRPRWTKIDRKPRARADGRPRDPEILTRDFGWLIRSELLQESTATIAKAAHVKRQAVHEGVNRVRTDLPAPDLVARRFQPYLTGLLLTPAHT